MRDGTPLLATAPGRPLVKPSKIYPAGRACSHDGCRTVLAAYNPGPACWTHSPRRIVTRVGAR